ncbi:FAD-dependent oxidoreductase, partial [Rhizobium leguminosarum]
RSLDALFVDMPVNQGIDAPAGSSYVPVWEPEAEIAEIDLKAEGITSVIWATGFSPDWSFVGLPIFDGNAYPVHRRGVTAV